MSKERNWYSGTVTEALARPTAGIALISSAHPSSRSLLPHPLPSPSTHSVYRVCRRRRSGPLYEGNKERGKAKFQNCEILLPLPYAHVYSTARVVVPSGRSDCHDACRREGTRRGGGQTACRRRRQGRARRGTGLRVTSGARCIKCIGVCVRGEGQAGVCEHLVSVRGCACMGAHARR